MEARQNVCSVHTIRFAIKGILIHVPPSFDLSMTVYKPQQYSKHGCTIEALLISLSQSLTSQGLIHHAGCSLAVLEASHCLDGSLTVPAC